MTLAGFLAHLVPAVWGLGAMYLVWGTRRDPPAAYPFLMASIAGILWLTLAEVPIWVSDHIPAEVITTLLLLAALLTGLEIIAHTIQHYDLGHRSAHVERVLNVVSSAMPRVWLRRDEDRNDR